jgi:hypothetical protein
VRGSLTWAKAGWNASLRTHYTGRVPATTLTGSLAPHLNVDLHVGYRFRRAVAGSFGRGLHVNVAIGNVFDTPPPLADTIDGYRGGSALGRAATVSFTLPL